MGWRDISSPRFATRGHRDRAGGDHCGFLHGRSLTATMGTPNTITQKPQFGCILLSPRTTSRRCFDRGGHRARPLLIRLTSIDRFGNRCSAFNFSTRRDRSRAGCDHRRLLHGLSLATDMVLPDTITRTPRCGYVPLKSGMDARRFFN